MVLRDRDTNGDGTLDERLYVLHDANYNVVALTNASGQVVERYLYDPYGHRTVLDANWQPLIDNPSQYGWGHGHQGLREDPETGLVHNRFRDYGPALGRFVQQDPAGYVEGANTYQYVSGSPQGRVDPMGLWSGIALAGQAEAETVLLPDMNPGAASRVVAEYDETKTADYRPDRDGEDVADVVTGIAAVGVQAETVNFGGTKGRTVDVSIFPNGIDDRGPTIVVHIYENGIWKETRYYNYFNPHSKGNDREVNLGFEEASILSQKYVEFANEIADAINRHATSTRDGFLSASVGSLVGMVPLGTVLTRSQLRNLLTSARQPKKGMDVVGHAFQKHANRDPGTWGGIARGGPKDLAEAGMRHLREILRGPGRFELRTYRYPDGSTRTFIEKRLPDGRGIRLNQDMTFKGFI